ncbi:MAG: DUF4194 domain-containing protein [Erysipelotrichaceae bacterium]|nr:DUF4194 domain-containing protein [Erysipelotrichaceae bacterium]
MMDVQDILGNVPKDRFRSVINSLLNECFILKGVADTASDYRFIMANTETFETVLDLLGYDLIVRDDLGVITVNNPAGTGRVHFSKLESILALILRLLYIEKMKELSQSKEVIVLLEEIYEKYDMLKLGKLGKLQMLNSLRSFKRVNLIQNLDRLDTGNMDIRIQIYPSIMLALTASSLDDAYKLAQEKLNEFSKGGEDVDDADERSDEDID